MRLSLAAPFLAVTLVASGAGPAVASRPFEVRVVDRFVDVDPCTGLEHEVTIDVTFHVHIHEDRAVARGERALSTSSGYTGRGTSSFVWNGNVELFRFADVLTNDAGAKIRARGAFLADIRDESVRLDTFELTCVGSSAG